MGKYLEISHFLIKFHSEGEFCHWHNTGIHLEATNQTFKANLGSKGSQKQCHNTRLKKSSFCDIFHLRPKKIRGGLVDLVRT